MSEYSNLIMIFQGGLEDVLIIGKLQLSIADRCTQLSHW